MTPSILANPPTPHNAQTPATPAQYLRGIGPIRAKRLEEMGLRTLRDLVTYYPRDWQDRRHLRSIGELTQAQKVTVRGTLVTLRFHKIRFNLGLARAQITDGTGGLEALWFKRTSLRYDVFQRLRETLHPGTPVLLHGGLEISGFRKTLRVEEWETLANEPEGSLHMNRIVPLYTLSEGIEPRAFRGWMQQALESIAHEIPDPLPESVRNQLHLPPLGWALHQIHFPDSWTAQEQARRALTFQEFFLFQTVLALVRRRWKDTPKPYRLSLRRTLLTPFREKLGFPLTSAQKRVIREIFEDMLSPSPMHRLLQGDVGSGKTVVALAAMLLAAENGGQAAMMVPTEILAEQHAISLRRFLKGLPCASGGEPLQWTLLTGRLTAKERRERLAAIERGEISLIVGTHALLEESVKFRRLILAVIDEQHRFGVEHRALLQAKGTRPDVLVMTATPIPRTLAMTLYGDLDVSTLDEMPPGRPPVETRSCRAEEAYAWIQKEVAQGRQAYIVYPLIEESDKLALKSVIREAARLRDTVFPNLCVGVLHGQLPAKEREAMMLAFRDGQLDILMSTTVIEVGIDVPNATVMAIEHADRFGLATLHQLRGRVGRGTKPSCCLLLGNARTEDAQRRLEALCRIHDGFVLSEVDLALRGPGEVLGTAQHGLSPFAIGRLSADADLLAQARFMTAELLRQDRSLSRPDCQILKRVLRERYAQRWQLAQVG